MASFRRRSVPITDPYPREQVYGAITFYLGSKEEVEADIAERERVEEGFAETHPAPADWKQELELCGSKCLRADPDE